MTNVSSDEASSHEGNSSTSSEGKPSPSSPQTAAELIRRRAAAQRGHRVENRASKEGQSSEYISDDKADLDEEIRRLEEELKHDDSDSSCTSSENEEPKAIVSLSKSKAAKTERLPASLLPAMRKRSMRGVDGSDDDKKKSKTRRGVAKPTDEITSTTTVTSADASNLDAQGGSIGAFLRDIVDGVNEGGELCAKLERTERKTQMVRMRCDAMR